MAFNENLRPQEPSVPKEGTGGNSFGGSGAEGTAPPRVNRIISPTRIAGEAIKRAGIGRRIVSPDAAAGPQSGGRRVVSLGGEATTQASEMPSTQGFPGNTPAEKRAARDAYISKKQAEAGPGMALAFEAPTPVESESKQSQAQDVQNEASDATKNRELDPVADAEYIKGEKARNVAQKIIRDNQLGENPDAVTLSEYGEAIAPEIDTVKSYFDAKIEGAPEHGIDGTPEAEVLDQVKALVGDTSKLGLLDGQLQATDEITRENMAEALILAASADPNGFKDRIEELGIKGADTYVLDMVHETATAEGMYNLHEQYLLSIGDEEGAARSMNARMGAERLDMSPEAVAEREEQLRIAEEDEARLTDEARDITKKILINSGKDVDADHAGHEAKVDREGVKVKEALDQLEYRILLNGGDDGGDMVSTVQQLVGSNYIDFGNGPELITKDNAAHAILVSASDDRQGFEERAGNLQGENADIANVALGTTSGESMTSYVDDVALSILNHGKTQDIRSGATPGTVEQVIVPTLSGDKVVEVPVKTDEVTGDGTAPVGWDSGAQKEAYTKIFGAPKSEALSDLNTTLDGSGDAVDSTGPTIQDTATGNINTGTNPPEAVTVGGADIHIPGGKDVPTMADAKDPDAVPITTDSIDPDSVPTMKDSQDVTGIPTMADAKDPDVVPTAVDSSGGKRILDTGEQDTSVKTYPSDREPTGAGAESDGEIIMPGQDTGGVDDGTREPREKDISGFTDTHFYTDGDTTVLFNPTTQEGSITIGGNTYDIPYKQDTTTEGRGDLDDVRDADFGGGDTTSDATGAGPLVIDATLGSDGVFGVGGSEQQVSQTVTPSATSGIVPGEIFGPSDASRAAAEDLRAEEGDFLASTAGTGEAVNPMSGTVVVGANVVEAHASELGGEEGAEEAESEGGSGDDAGDSASAAAV